MRMIRGGPNTPDADGVARLGLWQRLRRRWRDLDAQQRVRYLYFQMLDAAAQRELPRHAEETPRRYAPRLTQALDTVETDDEAIAAITGAFETVRYGGEEVTAEQVTKLHALWEQLRAKLSAKGSG